jgi:hypothetical protein
MVPLTELRHFYRLLRKTLVSTHLQLRIAEEILRDPRNLQAIVERSLAHFALYDNRGEGFHQRDHDKSLSDEVLTSQKPVHDMLRRVVKHGVRVGSCLGFDANFIDYEVSPIRTTGSVLENGIRTMGGGGVDLLLTDAADNLPAIGEAKGATDKNLLLGLIQALTYAVEFSTPFQRERLERAYPQRFKWPDRGPWLDLYLFMAGTPSSRHHPEFLRVVGAVCAKLLVPGTPVAGMVRRIVCLKTDLGGLKEVAFTIAFQHPNTLQATGESVNPS